MATAKSAPAESATPALVSGGFEFTPETLPRSRRTREQKPNEFLEPLKASYEAGQALGCNVEGGDQLLDAIAKIRKAAGELKVGARIVVRDANGQNVSVSPHYDSDGNKLAEAGVKTVTGTVRLSFQGVAKRAYTRT